MSEAASTVKDGYEVACTVGARIYQLRKAAGMSIADCADASKIHRVVWSRMERGRHTQTLETLLRVARVFGMKPSALLTCLDEME